MVATISCHSPTPPPPRQRLGDKGRGHLSGCRLRLNSVFFKPSPVSIPKTIFPPPTPFLVLFLNWMDEIHSWPLRFCFFSCLLCLLRYFLLLSNFLLWFRNNLLFLYELSQHGRENLRLIFCNTCLGIFLCVWFLPIYLKAYSKVIWTILSFPAPLYNICEAAEAMKARVCPFVKVA